MGIALWVVCLLASAAFYVEGSKRDNFAVKFGRFKNLPLTESDAIDEGFRKISEDCANNGLFSGNRYFLDGDTAVIVLYDSQGYVAGIQTGFLKSLIDSSNVAYEYNREPFVLDNIDGEDYYVLTAYFVNPDVICASGRTPQEFEDNPLGTELNLVGGTKNQGESLIPNFESELNTTLWTPGKCFPAMGMHYWYNMRSDMDCKNELYPVFLLYDQGELNGFGFAVGGNFENPRFEHPPVFTLPQFINPLPQCLKDLGNEYGLTTLHVYLKPKPLTIECLGIRDFFSNMLDIF